MHVAYHINPVGIGIFTSAEQTQVSQRHVLNACLPLFFLHCVPLRTCLYDGESVLVCGQFVVSLVVKVCHIYWRWIGVWIGVSIG
jgi:hypothetical protein